MFIVIIVSARGAVGCTKPGGPSPAQFCAHQGKGEGEVGNYDDAEVASPAPTAPAIPTTTTGGVRVPDATPAPAARPTDKPAPAATAITTTASTPTLPTLPGSIKPIGNKVLYPCVDGDNPALQVEKLKENGKVVPNAFKLLDLNQD